MASKSPFWLAFTLLFLASTTSALVVEHTFNVQNRTLRLLCGEQIVTVVNGTMPGPTVKVNEGDTLIVHVNNNSPYNLTIHWHGVFQLHSAWADGPVFVTQCPITPGNSYTYKFNVTGQEGTLWWHAHVGVLRATVYGALLIRPRVGRSYPFPKPHKEFPIILGEWWNANVIDIENMALATGGGPNISDAYTINGQPGDLYPCSSNDTFKIDVVRGKTYLLRIINAALNNQLFFKLAGHRLTVVSIDSSYTEPYDTDVIVVAPGQTTDALFTANQRSGNYYMAASPYSSAPALPFANGTTTAIVHYIGSSSSSTPLLPVQPAFNDTPTAHRFFSNLTSLTSGPHWTSCPRNIDHSLFITIGLGLTNCGSSNNCSNPFGSQYRFAASINNVSLELPTRLSLLEAFYFGVNGIYTTDFPSRPPIVFDYTNTLLSNSIPLLLTTKATRITKLKYNSTVEIVFQNTALITIENHPMHLHGFDFYVLAQGFGNFNRTRDSRKFNLINPQERNTIAVPVGGWAVIRFTANNPGVWFMHCHLDVHLPWGLATAFEVENGPTPETSLPPPPADLPSC
ncbi:laccase [Ranunculus cassubicifolius]